MSLFRRLSRAAKASVEVHGASQFLARGDAVICPVCSREEFVATSDERSKRPLFMSFNVPWLRLDRFTTSLICTHCAHVLTFARVPERRE